jgi:hypothetical protein
MVEGAHEGPGSLVGRLAGWTLDAFDFTIFLLIMGADRQRV